MPEGPEVEIARRQLDRWVQSKSIVDIRLVDPACIRTKLSTSPSAMDEQGAQWLSDHVLGASSKGVLRHGKRLGWSLGRVGLILHLGMTGKWVRRASYSDERHLRVAFQVDSGDWVCFIDARRFGALIPVEEHLEVRLAAGLGPDALDTHFDGPRLAACFRGRRAIKPALMDQQCLAGVGNIHAAEVLWKARIHPETRICDLGEAQWSDLAEVLAPHLNHVVRAQDSEELMYVTQGAVNPFDVYGRAGAICKRCPEKIENKKIQGRSTFFCGSCQVF